MLPISGGILFKGGDKLRKIPIENFFSPPYVYFPVPDDFKLTVDINETVKSGQVIATPSSGDLLPVFSSISGTVERFDGEIIYIKNDFKEEEADGFSIMTKPLSEIKSFEIETASKDLGIYDGTAPLFKKLKSAYGRIENIIINCTDSDPCNAINYRLVEEKFDEIIGGIKILIHATKARSAVIAIDEKIDSDFPLLYQKINDKKLILIRSVENKYPSGNEKVLLHALTRKEYQSDNLIKDGRSLILGAESIINLYTGLVYGKPQTRKLISVSGAVCNAKNISVPFGTKVGDIIEYCGGKTKEDVEIIANGFMTGFCISEDSTIGNNNSLSLITKENLNEHQCIHCGKCMQVCPMLLKPFHIYLNILTCKEEKNKNTGAVHCIGCGCCSYICPSNLPVSKVIFQSVSDTPADNHNSCLVANPISVDEDSQSAEEDPFFTTFEQEPSTK